MKKQTKNHLKPVLMGLSIVLVLGLVSVFGQAATKNQQTDNVGMMGAMNMENMDEMMKGMGMSDDMIKECNDHMKSGKMGDMMNGMMGGMSQEEHESHHPSS